MRWKANVCAAVLTAAVLITPACALECTIDGASPGEFGTPTSDETIYMGREEANRDRSKNAALIPPGFGTPASNLPGSGEALTPNLVESGGISVSIPSGGESVSYPVTAYTAVTSGLYYSGGYLGTLNIPKLNVRVKVYQGTDSVQLAKGAGHFEGTSIWDGNVCIAGHNRGVNCYFGQIHTLATGDRITLTTKLGTRTYAVTSVSKVRETDNSMLAAAVENRITLITCVRNQSAYRWCVQAVAV